MFKRIVLLCMYVLLIGVGDVEAKFRALLVGIDYQNDSAMMKPLYGAVNDAKEMYELMTATLGIAPQDIRLLTESQATRAAILRHFREWLIDGTSAGDVIFFQYAGHGLRVPDPTGTQHADPVKEGDSAAQTMAEAFVPFDVKVREDKTVKNLILDTELYSLLHELRDRHVYLFLDSCFSGGSTRDDPLPAVTTRYLHLPWPPAETRAMLPPDFITTSGDSTERGLIRRQQPKEIEWHPPYTFFASATHSQLAREYQRNGAFTYAVLRFLRANPGSPRSNRDVMDYARKFMHNELGYAESLQKPVLYGPEDAEQQPFVLLSKAGSTPAQPLPSTPPVTVPHATAVLLDGQPGAVRSGLQQAIAANPVLRLVQNRPDVRVTVRPEAVNVVHAAGTAIADIPVSQVVTNEVMAVLEHAHLVRQLAVLENPAAPFAVELWIDEPGKTQFTTRDRVTLLYRVNGLPTGRKAYLTLLNVAPDGTVAMLYPQKKDFAPGIGAKLYFNAEVETGTTYSIPRGQDALKPGQNVAVDLRLRLAKGEEYFKAIVTSEPIDWEQMGIGEFQTRFQGGAARGVVVEAVQQTTNALEWAASALRVEVTE